MGLIKAGGDNPPALLSLGGGVICENPGWRPQQVAQKPNRRRPVKIAGRRRKRFFYYRLDAVNDLAENVADGGTKDRQNDDNHDSDQNKNQRVFDQTLAFLLHFLEHGVYLLSEE